MGLVALNMSKLLQTGDNLYTMLSIMSACSIFHFSTLEEYYTGGLFLGPGNGVTDGSVIFFGLFITMGFIGNDFMTTKVYGEMPLSQAVCLFIIGNNIVMVTACFWKIIKHQHKVLQPDDITGEKLVLRSFFVQVVGYFLPHALLVILASTGGMPIISTKVADGELNPLFLVMLISCFLMQHMTCLVQVHHVCKSLYSPFNSYLVWFIMLATISLIAVFKSGFEYQTYFGLTSALCVILAVEVVSQWHFILNIVYEISSTLKIPVLRVKDKPVNEDNYQKV